ncbi:MAG: GNAT family N-acetyltransferase [Pirellula sp.]|jgi:RimJ/RimL family protein N-acetyltransferase
MNLRQSQVTIRDLLKEDAKLVFDLRCDPRLHGMQYAPSKMESAETLFAIMKPGPEIPITGFKCSAILVDGAFAGNISEAYSITNLGKPLIQLGWNLVPEFWGNGIMVLAIERLLQKRFSKRQDIVFHAFVFSTNHRSIRVIEKLGFASTKLLFLEWLHHLYLTRGKKRVLKYWLNFDLWNSRANHDSALAIFETSGWNR